MSNSVSSAKSDPFFDENAAAEYLGLKPQTLNAWRCLRRYTLSYVKVGRRIRYRKSELDRFITANTHSPMAVA